MAEKKVTLMAIEVDLGCEKCKRKIKKILCKIPQIQSQVYDEKANTVTVTVICCSPVKIKKKICCKGGDSIKRIEILEPKKPPPPPPEKKPPKEQEKPAGPKPDEQPQKDPQPPPPKKPSPEDAQPPPPTKPVKVSKDPKLPAPKKPEAPPPESAPPPPRAPEQVPVCTPVRTCCQECYRGYGGGPCYDVSYGRPPPCYEGYGRPAPPPCYEVCGRPVYESWGGGGSYYYVGCRRGCGVGRCDCLS